MHLCSYVVQLLNQIVIQHIRKHMAVFIRGLLTVDCGPPNDPMT
jgi:hypothetical protein